MSTYEIYLFGHFVGVFVFLASGGIGIATSIMATRTTSASVVSAMLTLQRKTDLYVFTLGGVLIILFGTLLVDEAGYGFEEAWISAAYVIILVMFGLVHGIMSPRMKPAREYAASLGNAAVDDELKERLKNPLVDAAGALMLVALIAVLWLMVVKPGA